MNERETVANLETHEIKDTVIIDVPEELHEKLMQLVERGVFKDIGEAVRVAIHKLLISLGVET
ncbi:hypothetical protein DRJ17_04630 [Candidatus Woesearchaeota archaeon]|nr:MAG: hypothetical protein DRJ17_04630 [Candidatus Woesearchaeota archaeon]